MRSSQGRGHLSAYLCQPFHYFYSFDTWSYQKELQVLKKTILRFISSSSDLFFFLSFFLSRIFLTQKGFDIVKKSTCGLPASQMQVAQFLSGVPFFSLPQFYTHTHSSVCILRKTTLTWWRVTQMLPSRTRQSSGRGLNCEVVGGFSLLLLYV